MGFGARALSSNSNLATYCAPAIDLYPVCLEILTGYLPSLGFHFLVCEPGSVGAGPRQVATEQGPQEEILKELSRNEPRNQQAISMELSSDESCCSTGNNQARDQAGITQLSWQLSSR